jgi:hypothetical protein
VEGLEDFERHKPHHQHNATTSGKIHLPPLITRHPTNPRGYLLRLDKPVQQRLPQNFLQSHHRFLPGNTPPSSPSSTNKPGQSTTNGQMAHDGGDRWGNVCWNGGGVCVLVCWVLSE